VVNSVTPSKHCVNKI